MRQELIGHAIDRALPTERALSYRAKQRNRIDAGLDPQRKGFGQNHLDAVIGAVVDELGDRSVAAVAEISHLIAEQIEDRLTIVVSRLLAADPDRELSGGRALGTAADRRVEHGNAGLGEVSRELAHQRR